MPPQPDNNVFLAVITQHKGIIYKVAQLYCQQEEDRKDLIQEIIYQLWRSFYRYDAQFQYTTWMYRIALNVAISFYRKDQRRRTTAQPLTDSLLQLAADAPPPDMAENLRLLHQCINALPPLEKALMLLYLEERSHKEMAEILGLSVSNIATRMSRVKDKLKKLFLTFNNTPHGR